MSKIVKLGQQHSDALEKRRWRCRHHIQQGQHWTVRVLLFDFVVCCHHRNTLHHSFGSCVAEAGLVNIRILRKLDLQSCRWTFDIILRFIPDAVLVVVIIAGLLHDFVPRNVVVLTLPECVFLNKRRWDQTSKETRWQVCLIAKLGIQVPCNQQRRSWIDCRHRDSSRQRQNTSDSVRVRLAVLDFMLTRRQVRGILEHAQVSPPVFDDVVHVDGWRVLPNDDFLQGMGHD
mmetsp:Transcript_17629/g.49899  ORF Transcript_17629/g.49899 Transcript_17629/m.49899 type:complete len:231 (+) Transcript_17629:2376-3068(+)